MDLDTIDVKILEILQKEGRVSFRDIASRVGVSTPTVSSKVKAMEEMGIIRGYEARIDADKLGEITIFLHLKCKPSHLKKVAKVLANSEKVREVFISSGATILTKATLADAIQIKDFLSRMTKIPQILSYEYYTSIKTVKEESRAIVNKGLSVILNCFYCGKRIREEPVKLKFDGRDHYLCCNTCAKSYKEKYERLKKGI